MFDRQPSEQEQLIHELDDIQIDAISNSLKSNHSDIDGLQSVVLGQCVKGVSMPKFSTVDSSKKFLQILNTGDHWVCITNRFSESTHDVFVYNSLYGPVSDSLVIQTSSILRSYPDSADDSIRFHIRECCQQTNKTRLCGFYAAAFALAVSNNVDPTGTFYDENTLPQQVLQRISSGNVDTIEGLQAPRQRNMSTVVRKKLYCVCHKPAAGRNMIQCDRCDNWLHATCVGLSSKQLRLLNNSSTPFTCSSCEGYSKQNRSHTVEVVDDSNDAGTTEKGSYCVKKQRFKLPNVKQLC